MLQHTDTSTAIAVESSICGVPHDWSGTSRGLHIDFGADEKVPLQPGDRLGHGSDAIVYETTIHQTRVAWKQISRRRRPKSNANIRQEIEILKKLSHQHLVRLIGSYTHKGSVGLLLYPVAVCDLESFFDDAEAYWQDNAADYQDTRLRQLGYSAKSPAKHKAWPIYSQIGCLLSAVAYLHSQSIRHKDIKPSNILLSQGRLWLSDFGLSRDFSHLTQSGTDGGLGTVRYKAPEVADFQQSGRAADIFSLGCVLLEIIAFDEDGTLRRLRPESPIARFVYHESLDKLNKWLPWPEDLDPVKHQLCLAVRTMLSRFPKQRPRIDDLVSRISLCDRMVEETQDRIFPDCCRVSYFTEQQSESRVRELQVQVAGLRQEVQILQANRRLYDPESQEWTDSDYQKQATQWARDMINKALKSLKSLNSKKKATDLSTTTKAGSQNLVYYSPRQVDELVHLILVSMIFVLLVLPVVAMFKLTPVGRGNSTFEAIGILVVFTLLFSAAMSLLTTAKRHELFAASAAYCAVLVVFISNFDIDGQPPR
ncbi:hypothetical protein E8E12_003714 [Didymella heteroderae]|uniref:non-specific serine/threonine protein kinase n=1 Tax=Didymella heteroderae TaxID=1769908 RepID=A0A9P5BWS3_9PLEO|nr:hypothetical protein E8E12_003714 [Didymella heteroderae]